MFGLHITKKLIGYYIWFGNTHHVIALQYVLMERYQ